MFPEDRSISVIDFQVNLYLYGENLKILMPRKIFKCSFYFLFGTTECFSIEKCQDG